MSELRMAKHWESIEKPEQIPHSIIDQMELLGGLILTLCTFEIRASA